MSRRSAWSSAVLAAVVAAAPALAGCTGGEAAGATALEGRSKAVDRARELDPEATLSKVSGHEGPGAAYVAGDEARPEEEPYWDRAADDPKPGDGRAILWAYEFLVPGGNDTVLQLVLDADGVVVSTSTEDRTEEDAPLPEDVLDSGEAVEAAKEANDDLRRGLEGGNATVAMHLTHDRDHPDAVWRVAGGGEDGGGAVTLDAGSGEVLESGGGD